MFQLENEEHPPRIVTWLIVNLPPEWIVFFFAIGVVFSVAFAGGSAWRLSTGLVSGILAGVSWLFGFTQSGRVSPEIVHSDEDQPTRDNPALVIIGRQPTRHRQESTALPSTSAPALTDTTDALVRRQTRSQTRLE